MRVLVTGGAGFVGSHIVERLLGAGDDVLVVDDLSTGRQANLPPGVRLEKLGIGDRAFLDVARAFRPELITHCAAQASVAVSMREPYMDAATNILGGINVCSAVADSGCDQFIYITTGGALYGEPDYLPCDEDHPIRPASAYALSKWTLECYLPLMLPATMPVKVLRLANVYGPRQDPDGEAGVVAIFGRRMMRGERVTIYGDGEQRRDFVYAADVARAHELARGAAESLTVNIASGVGVSVNELFRRMAAETYYVVPPNHGPERPGDLQQSVLSNARAKRLLGWTPETPLEDGLRQTLAWMGLDSYPTLDQADSGDTGESQGQRPPAGGG